MTTQPEMAEWPSGTREWWISGQELTEEEFELYRFRMWAVEGRLVDARRVQGFAGMERGGGIIGKRWVQGHVLLRRTTVR
jgi:hypothetical protein